MGTDSWLCICVCVRVFESDSLALIQNFTISPAALKSFPMSRMSVSKSLGVPKVVAIFQMTFLFSINPKVCVERHLCSFQTRFRASASFTNESPEPCTMEA